MTTVADVEALCDKLARAIRNEPAFVMVHPKVYKRHKRVFKAMLRRWRTRSLRRSVHRAYRKAGLPLPMVSR